MLNSLTGTQAVVIDKYRKLEKDIIKISKDDAVNSLPKDEGMPSSKNVDNAQKKSKSISDLLNEFANNNDVSFDMVKDKETDRDILVIRDNNTEEVIQQIPSELTLKIGKYIEENFGSGLLTNEKI